MELGTCILISFCLAVCLPSVRLSVYLDIGYLLFYLFVFYPWTFLLYLSSGVAVRPSVFLYLYRFLSVYLYLPAVAR